MLLPALPTPKTRRCALSQPVTVQEEQAPGSTRHGRAGCEPSEMSGFRLYSALGFSLGVRAVLRLRLVLGIKV